MTDLLPASASVAAGSAMPQTAARPAALERSANLPLAQNSVPALASALWAAGSLFLSKKSSVKTLPALVPWMRVEQWPACFQKKSASTVSYFLSRWL